MKRSYTKSLKEYEGHLDLDAAKILEAMKRHGRDRKRPTSVALEESTIRELKAVAAKQCIPYQVLIRAFILDGLDRIKKAA